eukprot:m.289808 g.289808  ORF g.289808 m.289808 type:complete len:73 (-) comp19461_c4_seq1:104-322(-)
MVTVTAATWHHLDHLALSGCGHAHHLSDSYRLQSRKLKSIQSTMTLEVTLNHEHRGGAPQAEFRHTPTYAVL